LQGFHRSTRSLSWEVVSEGDARRRGASRGTVGVRNVSACFKNRQQQSANLQALPSSPLPDSNRRPPMKWLVLRVSPPVDLPLIATSCACWAP
jgi:hypothetical protein